MQFHFSLKGLLAAIALIAGTLASALTFELQGLVCYASGLLLLLILWAPSNATFSLRLTVIFSGIGAALLCWSILEGCFPGQSIGGYWYHGRLAETGGWATGILVSGLRFSHILFREMDPGHKDAARSEESRK